MNSDQQLHSVFRPLEARVLHALWQRNTPATVRDLMPALPGIVYTTVITTLDRLFKKGVLTREKWGRAFLYQPKLTQSQQIAKIAADRIGQLLPAASERAESLIVMRELVATLADRDAALLDELEHLVAMRRAELKRKDAG